MLIYVSRGRGFKDQIFIWDAQTGVVITKIGRWGFGELVFSGNNRAITCLGERGSLDLYSGLDGTPIYKGRLVPPSKYLLGAHWVHEESLQFSTSSRDGDKYVINIQELHQTPALPLSLIKTFSVPSYDGKISFSPVSFHISFVTKTGVTILDIQDSRILLQATAACSPYTPPGSFSPDGHYFACGTEEFKICIWKNASANYVPWNNLWPRLQFKEFSFSPTSSSILTWGKEGIQLLETCSHSSPSKLGLHQQGGNHLVAYSPDRTHIAMAQREGSIVTVLHTHSNTPQQPLNVNMHILDIKIIGNAIFVADGHKLVGWDLETGEQMHNHETMAISTSTPHPHLILSENCQQIAFADREALFLYGMKAVSLYEIQAQRIICSHIMEFPVDDMRFSPSGHQLWCVTGVTGDNVCLVKLERGEGGNFGNVVEESIDSSYSSSWQSWINLFSSHDRHVGDGSEWVMDSKGNKLLWLPLSWRAKQLCDVRWDGNFLAFVGSGYPDPIIIEFQP